MDRKQFLEKWRDEFCGVLANAHVNHSEGGELSIRIRLSFRKMEEMLNQVHADLYHQPAPPAQPRKP